jgi:predicted ribosome quality control (RQC) complex YloA/Tae2 family protein
MPPRGKPTSRATRAYRTHTRQGFTILVGKGAEDNDILTFQVADPDDLWLHVSGWSGSHVVVRVPPDGEEPPREVLQFAARLAAWHSKARGCRGKVDVHVCLARDVSKPRHLAPGEVHLSRFTTMRVYATEPE